MNLLLWLGTAPLATILIKASLLLVVAVLADQLLSRRHPRWRQGLWRGTLLGCVLIAAAHGLPWDGWRIELDRRDSMPANRASEPLRDNGATVITPTERNLGESRNTSRVPAGEGAPNRRGDASVSGSLPRPRANWAGLGMLLWTVGFAWRAFSLVRGHWQIDRLLRASQPASDRVRKAVVAVGGRVGLRGQPRVVESERVTSPFACGVWRPCIVIPTRLAAELDEADLRVLLEHELAHLRRRDPAWCVAWQWMAAVGWFHPLARLGERAHALSCELEADRACAATMASAEEYRSSLARMVLRLVATGGAERAFVPHATSHLGKRLMSLERAGLPQWHRRHAVPGVLAMATLICLTAACRVVERPVTGSAQNIGIVAVKVVDEAGRPVPDAKVLPFGLRMRGDEASSYGWATNLFGPRETVITDAHGIARVTYPKMAIPEERLETSRVLLTVEHPDFGPAVSQGYEVDGGADPVRLRRGAGLRVSAHFGTPAMPVRSLLPLVSAECQSCLAWSTNSDGSRSVRGLAPGPHLVRVSGQLPSGALVHSTAIEMTLEAGRETSLPLELKEGIRLEGRLDSRVPRPVRNGRVLVSVRPPQVPASVVPEDLGKVHERYGEVPTWRAWRPVASDGTFVFESLPAGEVDVIALGDGFFAASGGTPMNRMPDGSLQATLPIGVPQSFALSAPITRIELVTEAAGALTLQVSTAAGEPVQGAQVLLSPNIMRFPGGIWGEMPDPSEAWFGLAAPAPTPEYTGVTDRHGRVAFANVPSCARGLDIVHSRYAVPLDRARHDRWVRFSMQPGATVALQASLVEKGVDFVGAKR